MTAEEYKNKLISDWLTICEAEVGYLEKASNSDLYSKTGNAGSNNYTKYWGEIDPSLQAQPWCACFVSWTLMRTVGLEYAKKLLKHWPYVYCPTMASLFTLNANPKVGDIVIFWRKGEFTHTGVVSYVNGDYFETYEGNTSSGHEIVANGGAVCNKSYYNSNLPGTKFITLDWSILPVPDDDLTDTESNTAINDINAMINRIDMLEDEVSKLESDFIYNYIDENMPDWVRGIVKALVDKGAIVGINDAGELALRYTDLRNIALNYRGGAYDQILCIERNSNGEIVSSPYVNYLI